MILRRLCIQNFRGIQKGEVLFTGHSLLVGGNSVGKSTICEAIDLLLGPDRLSRPSPIEEHDFYGRRYLDDDGKTVEISIEGVLTDLTDDVQRRFRAHIEYWDLESRSLLDETASPEHASESDVLPALRVKFRGRYDAEEDEFRAETFFASPLAENQDRQAPFTRRDKRQIGFLYLRALRTGTRALSLERGSLLDIMLRLKEEDRAQMWEQTLQALKDLDPPIHEIKQLREILEEIDKRVRCFVSLSRSSPSIGLFPSQLTREHLRRNVTLFAASERTNTLVPYWRLGSGVVNAMVFSLLTFLADLKQNVIFAMEEPELALPPHTQRRIVQFLRKSMDQVILTSHSPYVLEQFPPDSVIILRRDENGKLTGAPVELGGIKAKTYRGGLRRHFAEAMLGRAVLCVEGVSDDSVLVAASAVLENSSTEEAPYAPLDLSGVTVVPSDGQGNLAKLGQFFGGIGLRTYALFDKQKDSTQTHEICNAFDHAWELDYSGIEKLLAEEVPVMVQHRFFAEVCEWPDYPSGNLNYHPDLDDDDVRRLTARLLKLRKGSSYAARLIELCEPDDLPEVIVEALRKISDDLPIEPTSKETSRDEDDDGDSPNEG